MNPDDSKKGKAVAAIRDNLNKVINQDLTEEEKNQLLVEAYEIAKTKAEKNSFGNKKFNFIHK